MNRPVPPGVAGVVPAAGASRRMGRPKGLLELGGATFAHRVVRALQDGGCHPVYVVVDADDEALRGHVADMDVVVLSNPSPGEGPITSLRLALAAVPEGIEGVVYLPLDHALVEGAHVARLLDEARRTKASLALPVHEGKRGHPAYFARTLFSELLDPDLEGGARTVVHRYLSDACLVETEDPAVVADIDTPEAYRQALARFEAAAAGSPPS